MNSLGPVTRIFAEYEEMIEQKTLISHVSDIAIMGIGFVPEFYQEGGQRRLKCTIKIEVIQPPNDDDDIIEEISDTISDWLVENGVRDRLLTVGIDPEVFDWLPVEFVVV